MNYFKLRISELREDFQIIFSEYFSEFLFRQGCILYWTFSKIFFLTRAMLIGSCQFWFAVTPSVALQSVSGKRRKQAKKFHKDGIVKIKNFAIPIIKSSWKSSKTPNWTLVECIRSVNRTYKTPFRCVFCIFKISKPTNSQAEVVNEEKKKLILFSITRLFTAAWLYIFFLKPQHSERVRAQLKK